MHCIDPSFHFGYLRTDEGTTHDKPKVTTTILRGYHDTVQLKWHMPYPAIDMVSATSKNQQITVGFDVWRDEELPHGFCTLQQS